MDAMSPTAGSVSLLIKLWMPLKVVPSIWMKSPLSTGLRADSRRGMAVLLWRELRYAWSSPRTLFYSWELMVLRELSVTAWNCWSKSSAMPTKDKMLSVAFK